MNHTGTTTREEAFIIIEEIKRLLEFINEYEELQRFIELIPQCIQRALLLFGYVKATPDDEIILEAGKLAAYRGYYQREIVGLKKYNDLFDEYLEEHIEGQIYSLSEILIKLQDNAKIKLWKLNPEEYGIKYSGECFKLSTGEIIFIGSAQPCALTEREEKYYNRAIEAGLMEATSTGYKWLFGAPQCKTRLAYFLDGVERDHKGAYITAARTRVLEARFDEKDLKGAFDRALDTPKQNNNKEWRAQIDKLFED